MKLIFKAFSRHYEEIERRSQTMSTLGLWFNSTFFNRARNQQTNLHNIHYDLGNDLYEAMLDMPFMSYTCAFWLKHTRALEEAQENKLALLAQKLDLRPGMRVLDIGCGFG